MRRVFFHIHIYKCGGTSISNVLRDNFGDLSYSTTDILNSRKFDAVEVERALKRYPRARAFTGHRLSLDLPYNISDVDLRVFTFVRDPVDYLTSYYYYAKSLLPNIMIANVEGCDLCSWIEAVCSSIQKGEKSTFSFFHDTQLKFLTGSTGDSGLRILRKLLEDKNKCVHVFPLSRMPQSLALLHNLYPDDFRFVRLLRRNTTSKDMKLDESHVRLIRETLFGDAELYSIANACLDDVDPDLLDHGVVPGPPLRFYLAAALRRVASYFVLAGKWVDDRGAK